MVTANTSELKAKILELLERDEEFRYAIAGKLGLLEILKRLDRIEEELKKLWLKSLEHDKRFEEINKRFEAIERKLLEHDKRFKEINKRFEAIERKLLEHDKRFEAIERKLLEHDKRFEAIERKLLEHDKKFDELNIRVSRIELELGALNEAFYCKALWEDLREEIKLNNEKVILRERNARINEEDIDYLIVTDKKVYVVEVKTKPKHQDIGNLIVKADLASKHYPDKQVIPILAGSMIGREIEEYAKEKKIRVYKI